MLILVNQNVVWFTSFISTCILIKEQNDKKVTSEFLSFIVKHTVDLSLPLAHTIQRYSFLLSYATVSSSHSEIHHAWLNDSI